MIRRPPKPPLFPSPPLFRSHPRGDRQPTRRRSNLDVRDEPAGGGLRLQGCGRPVPHVERDGRNLEAEADRKSTRLNSSHLVISYAVFCLKKKKTHSSTINIC